MNRRRVLATLAAAPLLGHWARAQAGAKRVAFVPSAGAARDHRRHERGPQNTADWVGKRLAESGLQPGRDFVVEYVDLELTDDVKAIDARAKALVASGPDLVLVAEDGIEAMARATRTIPLVFYQFSGDPEAFGLIQSYNRPGGNVTGTTLSAPGADAKGWELLRELAPKAKRLGFLFRKEDLEDRWSLADIERAKPVAARLGFETVQITFARTPVVGPIERAIRAAHVDVLDAGAEIEDPWIKDLMRFVERNKLPTLWAHEGRVREGGLAAVHGAYGEAMRDAIAIAARILRGAKPGEVPVASPKNMITAINLRTARAMGLAIPPGVRVRASVVVE